MSNPQASFEAAFASYTRDQNREHISLAEEERKEVLTRFPRDGWEAMPLERYALGQKDSEETFCRWMEFRSRHMGSIKGGSARMSESMSNVIDNAHRNSPTSAQIKSLPT